MPAISQDKLLFPNNLEWAGRIFSKGKRFDAQLNKTIISSPNRPTLQLPENVLQTHGIYHPDTNERYYMVEHDTVIFVQLVNKTSGLRDKVVKFNKADGSYIGEIGFPAPDIHSFGIQAIGDTFFMSGGIVPTEPGYRKNFKETPQRWERMSNNLEEGPVGQMHAHIPTKKIIYKSKNRIYIVDTTTGKGKGNTIRGWLDYPEIGGILGFYDNHVALYSQGGESEIKYHLISNYAGDKLAPPVGPRNGIFYGEDNHIAHSAAISEASRILSFGDFGIDSHSCYLHGGRTTLDTTPQQKDCFPENIGKGYIIYTTDNGTRSIIIDSYSGEKSEPLSHPHRVIYQATGEKEFLKATETGKFTFHKIN